MKTITLIIILQLIVTLLTGCSEFPINAEQGEVINQLNCEPAESNGCAGWLPPDEIVVIE